MVCFFEEDSGWNAIRGFSLVVEVEEEGGMSRPVVGVEETAIERGADEDEVRLCERVCLRSRLIRVGGGDDDEDKD